MQTRRGIPVRWSWILLLVVVWNAFFLLDGSVSWKAPKAPGPLVLLALGLFFSAAVAIGRSAWLQSWVLKPGRSVWEIRAALSLLQLVTGLMLVIFSALLAFAWRAG